MLHSALINVMVKAARRAGRSLKRDLGEIENLQVSLKGPANFVTMADRRAEEMLHSDLTKARPGYGFIGEEGGTRERGSPLCTGRFLKPAKGRPLLRRPRKGPLPQRSAAARRRPPQPRRLRDRLRLAAYGPRRPRTVARRIDPDSGSS